MRKEKNKKGIERRREKKKRIQQMGCKELNRERKLESQGENTTKRMENVLSGNEESRERQDYEKDEECLEVQRMT